MSKAPPAPPYETAVWVKLGDEAGAAGLVFCSDGGDKPGKNAKRYFVGVLAGSPAALRGYAGCEVLAMSNWLLGRDDQVGCALFWPLDQLEHHRT